MDVVEEIPADVVGVVVDDEIVAAVPALVGEVAPVPIGNLEVEAAGKPEFMMGGVNAGDGVAERGTKVGKVAVLEGMLDMEARVIDGGVAVPSIVINVGHFIDASVDRAFRIGA